MWAGLPTLCDDPDIANAVECPHLDPGCHYVKKAAKSNEKKIAEVKKNKLIDQTRKKQKTTKPTKGGLKQNAQSSSATTHGRK